MRCLAFMDPPKTPPALSRVDMELDLDQPSLEDHGLNNGEPAPCRRSSKGITTCMACIGIEQSRFLAALEPEARDLCLDMIEKIEMAGRQGLSYEAFTVSSSTSWLYVVERLSRFADRSSAKNADHCSSSYFLEKPALLLGGIRLSGVSEPASYTGLDHLASRPSPHYIP